MGFPPSPPNKGFLLACKESYKGDYFNFLLNYSSSLTDYFKWSTFTFFEVDFHAKSLQAPASLILSTFEYKFLFEEYLLVISGFPILVIGHSYL